MKRVMVAVAVLAGSTVSVSAGGYVEPAVAPVPVMVAPTVMDRNWQGPYVGGSLTYGKGEVKAKDDLGDAISDAGFSRTLGDPDGWGGALRAGYDWQFNQFVLGLGGSYDFGKYEDSKELFDSGLDLDTKVSNVATVFVRAGYDMGQWMPYVLAGYSWADGRASIDGIGSEKVSLDGYTVGLGAEYMFNDRWSGFAEYNYTDFGDVEKTDGQVEADLSRINLGVNYRF